MMRIRRAIVASILASLLMCFAAPAGLAQSPSDCRPKGYCGEAGEVQGVLQATESAGLLPFTGMQIGLFAAGGGLLLLGGAALLRASRNNKS